MFVGQTFLLYCVLYSIERFFVEGLRTDNLLVHFPWGDFRQAQVLSVIVVIAAAVLYIWLYRRAVKSRSAIHDSPSDSESDSKEAKNDGAEQKGECV
jgi:prolipoprotein diacylglyceryltransferase